MFLARTKKEFPGFARTRKKGLDKKLPGFSPFGLPRAPWARPGPALALARAPATWGISTGYIRFSESAKCHAADGDKPNGLFIILNTFCGFGSKRDEIHQVL